MTDAQPVKSLKLIRGSLRTACGCQKLTRETDDERNSRFPFGYRALSLMERICDSLSPSPVRARQHLAARQLTGRSSYARKHATRASTKHGALMNLATPQSPLQARDALCVAPFFAYDP